MCSYRECLKSGKKFSKYDITDYRRLHTIEHFYSDIKYCVPILRPNLTIKLGGTFPKLLNVKKREHIGIGLSV